MEPKYLRGETEQEFIRRTVQLLVHKCLYYVHNHNVISDYEYDMKERAWRALGCKLDLLNKDDTSPCTDFDFRHPRADQARYIAWLVLRKEGSIKYLPMHPKPFDYNARYIQGHL